MDPATEGLLATAVEPGRLGELFWRVDEPVVIFESGLPLRWNPAASRVLGLPPPDPVPAGAVPVGALAPGAVPPTREAVAEFLAGALGEASDELSAMVRNGAGGERLRCTGGCGAVFDVTVWTLGGSAAVVALLRDVSQRARLTEGMARLSSLGRELLGSEPLVPDLLQRIADEARVVTGASFSAVMLVRAGAPEEVTHFAYNAPRERFPERLPRAVGLLAVALQAGHPVRLDDIRGAPGAVGIPVKHPPVAGLLAAPVHAGEEMLGLVAVADEPGARPFDAADEALVVDLAAHCATAVRLAQARELARVAAERRRIVVATARHDVRNPLAAGRGYAQTLLRHGSRMTPDQRAHAAEHLVRVFERLESFTERLLLQDDDLPPQPERRDVSVAALLDEVRADHAAALGSYRSALVVSVQPDAPARFPADPDRAREALDNLVGNAVKHGRPGGVVTLTVRAEGDQVRFDVHDEGEGIPVGELARVFDRAWRSPQTRARGVPGSGLGLAIVRDVADVHGGVVGVSSRPGEGTTFWVTFPLHPDAPPAGGGRDARRGQPGSA